MFYRKARLHLLRSLPSFQHLWLGLGLRRPTTIRRFVRQKEKRPGIDNTLDSRPLVPIFSRTGNPECPTGCVKFYPDTGTLLGFPGAKFFCRCAPPHGLI